MRSHANRGHAAAKQLKRSLVNNVDEVPEQCEARRALDKAPHVPIAGAWTVSMFSNKLYVDILRLDDNIAVHVLDVFPNTPY